MSNDNIAWAFPSRREPDPYQLEWDHLVQAIREDKPYNEVKCGVMASLVTSMGRLACHSAQEITVDQIANELTYRMFGDQLFVSGRYNTVSGKLAGIANDINVKRTQLGGGWFLTPTVMMKGEWVNQKYLDFPTTDIRNGGKFKGFMVEATVAF